MGVSETTAMSHENNVYSNEIETPGTAGRSRGVQSVEVAVRLLAALARAGGSLSLRDLSAEVHMAPAKVHRYMASFVETGMVDHRRSGSYDLGRLAGEIGLEAVTRIDFINQASDQLPNLVDRVNASGFLSVWGPRGPMIVRWERAQSGVYTVLGVGTTLPIAPTSTGRCFLAHLPVGQVIDAFRNEEPHAVADLEALRARDNDGTIFRGDGSYIQNQYTLSKPILNFDRQAIAVVTLISRDRRLIEHSGPAEIALRAF